MFGLLLNIERATLDKHQFPFQKPASGLKF